MLTVSKSVRRLVYKAEAAFRSLTGLYDSDEKLVTDNQTFWENTSARSFGPNSHWRGYGPFEDDSVWLGLGDMHWKLFQRVAQWAGMQPPYGKAVEWGCGGGMNAVHFAPEFQTFYGVDISEASLQECGKQMSDMKQDNFVPVKIRAEDPEGALDVIPPGCDLFLSTYVFELLPTPEYGMRVLQIASQLLRPGGVALIQIRYGGATLMSRTRRWSYRRNMTGMSTYSIDNFWKGCVKAGLEPAFVHLLPEQPELSEERYAYFALSKPENG